MAVAMQYGSGNYNAAYGSAGGGGGISMTLLWTNTSPTSSFSAQTVSLDLSDYDAVMVVLNTSTSSTGRWWQFGFTDGLNAGGDFRGTSYSYHRTFAADSAGVTFETGYRDSTSGASYAIPISIYGIKGI